MLLNSIFFKISEAVGISPARRDRLIFVSLVLSGLVNALAWILIPLFLGRSKEFVVLQYNIYFGISSLGHWLMLFLLPLSGLLVGAINFSLAFYLYLKERALSLSLAAGAVAFQLIILTAVILIIYLNI
ncbi:MAG: hypothetical protein WC517_03490 [Patescibacteria group bacterium]